MADIWSSNADTFVRSNAGVREAVRCLGCVELFYRDKGTDDACSTCPTGTACTTNVWSTRWQTPAS